MTLKPLSDFAIGGFQRARAGGVGVEFGGKARTIAPERVQLGVQRLLAAVCVPTALDRRRERVER